MTEFFAICEYFGITPVEFFDDRAENPRLTKELLAAMGELDEADLSLTLTVVRRLLKK